VKTEWDVMRFADRVKNSRVTMDGERSKGDLSLPSYFPQACFGELEDPATILDAHGRIIVWHLPDILHVNRIVSHALHTYLLRFSE
jgi:hypothetical protein